MRVLFVSKFGYMRGGLERVLFDEIDWLRQSGHEAELFTTGHPQNLAWTYASDFPHYHEIGVGGRASLRAVRAMFWNAEAKRSLERVISAFRPDVIHFHGIHRHLSPSVVEAARRAGVPCVITLHDYWPVCPSGLLLRGGSSVCDPPACQSTFLPAIAHRCIQGSVARSTLAAAELGFQRATRAYEHGLDAVICPSQFLKSLVESHGFAPGKMYVLANAVKSEGPSSAPSASAAFLFAGRLSHEKGLPVLLEAARRAGVRLIVAGDGSERPLLDGLDFVEYRGMLGSKELASARRETLAAVVPSTWFENAPLAVLESMAYGRPVIGSEIGGIPELIRDGVDGLLVAPGSVEELANALSRIAGQPALAYRLGTAGRERVNDAFSPLVHLNGLLGIYARVMAGK